MAINFLVERTRQPYPDFVNELINAKDFYRQCTEERINIKYCPDDSIDWYLNNHMGHYYNMMPDEWIPVGTINFVSTYLLRFYPKCAASLLPLNVPDVLLPFAGRRIFNIDHEEQMTAFPEDRRLYVKSRNLIKSNENGLVEPTERENRKFKGFQVSEIVRFDSEWRVFIFMGNILHVSNYAGKPLVFPDVKTIEKMRDVYDGEAPVAYTLDVGVTEEGSTAVIECHRFFSCGLYGFNDLKKYPKMLSQTWYEMKNIKY